jgi:dihydroxyacetone kinase-like protein
MTADRTAVDTALIRRWLELAARAVHERSGYLTELDSAIGDADHGGNLDRGFTAVLAALDKEPPQTPGAALTAAGRRLISSVGGASGPLYGTALRRAGRTLGDTDTATPEQLADALDAALAGVRELGAAAPGDKTMVDALHPAAEAYRAALRGGAPLAAALAEAARAADQGAAATVPLQARKGRASYLGGRSIGHQDPGATSTALLLAALAAAADSAQPLSEGQA